MKTEESLKICPYCNNFVKIDAIKCRHCKSWLNEEKEHSDPVSNIKIKKCDKCDTEIKPNQIRCSGCGKVLWTNTVGKDTSGRFSESSLTMMWFLSVFTVGLYVPFWFDKTILAINKRLKGKFMIGRWMSIISLVLIIALIVLVLVNQHYANVIEENLSSYYLGDSSINSVALEHAVRIEQYSLILRFTTVAFFWIICFRIKKALEIIGKKKIYGFPIFFFNVFYLQHKINQIEKSELT